MPENSHREDRSDVVVPLAVRRRLLFQDNARPTSTPA